MKKPSFTQASVYLVAFLLLVLIVTQLAGLTISITAHAHQKDADAEYSGQLDLKLEPQKHTP